MFKYNRLVIVGLALLSAACGETASRLTSPSAELTDALVGDPVAVASSNFLVLANAGATCTDGNVLGVVGTFSSTGAITRTTCPITGALHVGDIAATQAFNAFLNTYAVLAPQAGDVCTMLTGTLAGVILAPGEYCFNAAATVTPVDARWTGGRNLGSEDRHQCAPAPSRVRASKWPWPAAAWRRTSRGASLTP
jgi:hypothetical protein